MYHLWFLILSKLYRSGDLFNNMAFLKIQSKKCIFPLILAVSTLVRSDNYYYKSQSSFGTEKSNFSWDEVLNTMSYHRHKMNEYLCKNYIASEIVENFHNRSYNVEKRVGKPVKSSRLARNSLLSDPGSQNYRDWLSRSSTLEDIYRQFEHSGGGQETLLESEADHEGDVTGYALLGHKHFYSKPAEYEQVDSHVLGYHLNSHSEEHYEEESDHVEKGMKLKELFHFALTAIAFLAFATFMIEVIMCLVDVPQQPTDPDYVLVPTTTGITGSASKIEEPNLETFRKSKSLGLTPLPLETINSMSSKVLSSIEALTNLYEDNGHCLQQVLCENSKFSKTISGVQKIWLPIWSFGASWIAGRLKERNLVKGANTMEYLKSAVLGLGRQECHKLYSKCNRNVRFRKRRKAI